jgi:glycosyltransferase involved in cell wall biosynthesis
LSATRGRITDVELSVIVPMFNAADFVAGALDKAANLSSPSVEVVVVDDGSSDATPDLLRAAVLPSGTQLVIRTENGGPATARRDAVGASSGRYVWFVDVDDRWDSDGAEALVVAARDTSADVVVGNALVLRRGRLKPVSRGLAATTMSGHEAFRWFLRGRIRGHLWTKLIARNVLDSIEFTDARVHSDLAMVAQALGSAERVAIINRVVYEYRVRPGSVITGARSRGDSLAKVDSVVVEVAQRLGLGRSRDLRYFRVRFILLSAVRDANFGAYPDEERSSRLMQARNAVRWRDALICLARGDVIRTVLVIASKLSNKIFVTASKFA